MTISRGLVVVASSSLLAAWFVTLAVRVSVGSPGVAVPAALAAFPAARRALAPLRIPARDPFAADVAARELAAPAVREPALAALGPVGVPGAPGAQTDVPDVAGLAAAAPGVGVIATIVGDGEAYALVDERGTTRIARVHDVLAGSRIVQIANDAVTLANGVRLPLEATGARPAAPRGMPAQPEALPGFAAAGSGARASDGRADGSSAPAALSPPAAHDRAGSAVAGPGVRATTDISTYGHTVLTSPNGAPVLQEPAAAPIPIASPPSGAPAPWSPGAAAAPAWPGSPR